MAEPTFEDYLKEREMLDKKNMMENLMREYQDDMNRKKVMEQKQMAGTDTPEIEIEMLQELLDAFREKFNRDPVSIDELKKATEQMRKKSATGGLTRTSYAMGKGPVLPSDEDPINPFGPKPEGPVLPEKSMMATNKSYMDYVRAALAIGVKPIRIDEFESLTPIMDINQILKITEDLNKRTSNATGGRAGFAEGTDNMKMASGPDIQDERNELSMKLFNKPLRLLTPEEMDILDEEAERLMQKFMADGGRVLKQTGGITEQRVLPPEFIEAAQRTFLTDLATQSGLPSVTTATTQQPGETAAQFAQRQAQAQQFGITKAGMAELAPQVAAQDPLQAAAYQQAVDPTTGLGSFQPFLTKAGAAADATTALTGTGAGTGAGSISSYMSPYQQQVIDTTMQDFDQQAQIRQNQLAAQTLGVPGAFGGGREGVQRAQYQAQSDQNRAQTLANLRQTGFQNAAARRQQDLANQMNISNLQGQLGARAQDFSRAQISGLGTLGATQQAQNQAILDAQRQAAQMAIEEPRQGLARFGQGIAAITPGAGTVSFGETPAAPQSSPLATALGLGLVGADIYGRIF